MYSFTSSRLSLSTSSPVPCRWCPVQSAIGMHLGSQVHDVALADRIAFSHRRGRKSIQPDEIGEAGLLLEPAYARARMKHEFGNLKVWIRFRAAEVAERVLNVEWHFAKPGGWLIGKRDAEESCAGRGKRDGVFFSAVVGDVDEFAEALAIVTRLYICNRRRSTEHIGCCRTRIIEHQCYGMHRLRRRE